MTIAIPGVYSYLIKIYIDMLSQNEGSDKGMEIILLAVIIFCVFLTVLMKAAVYLRIFLAGLLLRKTLTGILY